MFCKQIIYEEVKLPVKKNLKFIKLAQSNIKIENIIDDYFYINQIDCSMNLLCVRVLIHDTSSSEIYY